MKKKILHTVLSIAVGAGILSVGGVPTQAKSQNQEMNDTYAIAFKSGLPENYQEVIRKAGGKVIKVLPEVGGIEAQSDEPSFLKNLKGNSSIEAANREIPLTLDKQQTALITMSLVSSASKIQRVIGTPNGIFKG